MKIKKKIYLIILVVLLVGLTQTLFACGKNNSESPVGGEPQSSWTAKCDLRQTHTILTILNLLIV